MYNNDLTELIDLLHVLIHTNLLKQSIDDPNEIQLDRTIIDPDRIRSIEHSRLAGLQIADAVASSLHFSVKKNIS